MCWVGAQLRFPLTEGRFFPVPPFHTADSQFIPPAILEGPLFFRNSTMVKSMDYKRRDEAGKFQSAEYLIGIQLNKPRQTAPLD